MKMTVEIVTTKTIDPTDIADAYWSDIPDIVSYIQNYLEDEEGIDSALIDEAVWDEILRQVGEKLRDKIAYDCM